jgi:hypothetical protein
MFSQVCVMPALVWMIAIPPTSQNGKNKNPGFGAASLLLLLLQQLWRNHQPAIVVVVVGVVG